MNYNQVMKDKDLDRAVITHEFNDITVNFNAKVCRYYWKGQLKAIFELPEL